VIPGPSCQRSRHPVKPQLAQIEFIHERINNTHRIVFTDVVIKAVRQQSDLTSVFTFNEPFHFAPSINHAQRIDQRAWI